MWSAFTAADVIDQFTVAESLVIKRVQGGLDTKLPLIVAKVVAQVQADIRSGGYGMTSDATLLPLGLHNDAIAIARWKLLVSITDNPNLQTKERKAENDDALEKLKLIAAGKYAIEPPPAEAPEEGNTDMPRTGSWNSENKVIGRMHPTPRPASQYPVGRDYYANPAAPPDGSPE